MARLFTFCCIIYDARHVELRSLNLTYHLQPWQITHLRLTYDNGVEFILQSRCSHTLTKKPAQIIHKVVQELLGLRSNPEHGALLCVFWIGLQEYLCAHRANWETKAARETRGEHWLRVLHAYSLQTQGHIMVEAAVRAVLDPVRTGEVGACFHHCRK